MAKRDSPPTSPPAPTTGGPRQQVKVSLTPAHLAALDAKAAQLGLTRSQLLERLIERAQLVPTAETRALGKHIARDPPRLRRQRGDKYREVEPHFKPHVG